MTFIDHTNGIVTNGSLLGKKFSANVFNELYPAPKEVRQAAEQQQSEQKQRIHTVNPISGVVDMLLDLADTKAYEEQQKQIQRRKKQRLHR